MRKTYLFMMVSLDGFFLGPDHDLYWHNTDEEFDRFASDQLNQTHTIIADPIHRFLLDRIL